jgi:hypothetical protein
MKLVSFDVGIKNMAYCFFDISGENIGVKDWNVINLMPDANKNTVLCNCNITIKGNKKKNIKPITKTCGNKAKYTKNEFCFCERHARTASFLMPSKNHKSGSLNKMKTNELKQLALSFNIIPENTKKSVVEQILEYFNKHSLEPIIKPKSNASNIDLITIGKNIKIEFDKVDFSQVDCVIIENQISPIANRMKSIQGMLAQYFIMRHDSVQIEFLSSSNKLKGFEKEHDTEDSNYKQHKMDAVFHTKRIIENPYFSSWKSHVINHKKIDDLADAFLQGLWYLKKHNIINIA